MTEMTPSEAELLEYITGKVTKARALEIETWVEQHEDNKKLFVQLAKIYFVQESQRNIIARDVESAYYEVRARIKARTKKKRNRRYMQVAAAAAILLMLNALVLVYMGNQGPDEYVQLASNGNRNVEYILPDGTKVSLNTHSKIIFPVKYASNERTVTIEGEAFFDVAHNKDKPFVVKTLDDNVRVKVLGTKFNVQAYAHDSIIQTTLIDGSVQLSIANNNDILLKPLDRISINRNTHKVEKIRIAQADKASWMDNRLVFRDTPLPEVMRTLSHYYNVDVEIVSDMTKTYLFTGTFQNQDLTQVLNYIQISSKIKYDIQKGNTEKLKVILNI